MMHSKQDPVYKNLCRVFEKSGLAQHFPNYKNLLYGSIEGAYAKNIEHSRWQGDWAGDKFHKYMTKCALNEFLARQSYAFNPLLTKQIVSHPLTCSVTAQGDDLYVEDQILATEGKEIDITPAWMQRFSTATIESQCA